MHCDSAETLQKVTPMMAQWQSCKDKSKDAVLLFRMGDFYEAFYEDAAILSKEVDLTLTKRQGIPMSGMPHHSADNYIDRLVSKGYRVAIAEQTEDPKLAKGLVKREIVRIITPGSLVSSSLLNDKQNNYFISVSQSGTHFGLALLDLSTGEFRVMELEDQKELMSEIYRIRPSEFLVGEKWAEKNKGLFEDLKLSFPFLLSTQPEWTFDYDAAYPILISHFQVHSLDGFGMKGMTSAVQSAGALLAYARDHLSLSTNHIRQITPYNPNQFLNLDRTTLKNLEITESLQDGSKRNTLLGVLDSTSTPMGARMMRKWLLQPLSSVNEISKRQNAVANFMTLNHEWNYICDLLDKIRDLERLMMKISTGYASARDLIALQLSLAQVPLLKICLKGLTAFLLNEQCDELVDLSALIKLIETSLVEDPPLRVGDGQVFRDGFHPELDSLRQLARNGKTWIAEYQVQLREMTGIKTLRVGFTGAFGYYIEVSKGQADRMPETFTRRQTLVNTERYITPTLKEYEDKVLTAEDRLERLETELFNELRLKVNGYADAVQQTAKAIATIDCLLSFAKVAKEWQYVCPQVDESHRLSIIEGRHPVIEACILGRSFTPNDAMLDNKDNRLLLLTGPNMAGKSTYIRQVALITLMAHIGSFVPAKEAKIGLVDKIFTRIGASDDLSRGQSTFMVEMSETANILHNATDRSLVILDEIGRGTSTYDGISIAWAVAEYLLTMDGKKAKTLFATHYWELTKLEEKIRGAVNYTIAVEEVNDEIVFMHKIVRGGTDKSYGIHVARLAGMPQEMLHRAKEILQHLEENANRKEVFIQDVEVPIKPVKKTKNTNQMLLFQQEVKDVNAPIVDDLKKIDPNQLSPLQALQKLMDWKALIK
ncbi:MAG: DNA mismatch repair protein MutS [Parachlamydiales bacterium]|nr:DNA mismatch repair protein MutS [Parachlamydiales bacterium]